MSSVANATRRMVRGAVGIGSILGGGGNGASVGTTAIENAGFVSPGMVSGAVPATARAWGASPSVAQRPCSGPERCTVNVYAGGEGLAVLGLGSGGRWAGGGGGPGRAISMGDASLQVHARMGRVPPHPTEARAERARGMLAASDRRPLTADISWLRVMSRRVLVERRGGIGFPLREWCDVIRTEDMAGGVELENGARGQGATRR